MRELHFDKVFELTSNDAGSDDHPNRVNVLFRLDWLRQRVKPGLAPLFSRAGQSPGLRHRLDQEVKSAGPLEAIRERRAYEQSVTHPRTAGGGRLG